MSRWLPANARGIGENADDPRIGHANINRSIVSVIWDPMTLGKTGPSIFAQLTLHARLAEPVGSVAAEIGRSEG